MDLSACADFFISLSGPHFYMADEKLRQKVDGMNPNEKVHETGIYFDLVCTSIVYESDRHRELREMICVSYLDFQVFLCICDKIWKCFI